MNFASFAALCLSWMFFIIQHSQGIRIIISKIEFILPELLLPLEHVNLPLILTYIYLTHVCLPCLFSYTKIVNIIFHIPTVYIQNIALRCYTCSYVPTTGSRACIENPDKVGGQKFTNCNKKFCTILRQELVVSI